MCEFRSTGFTRFTGAEDLLIRLAKCLLPVIAFPRNQLAISAALALLLGLLDGWARIWGSPSARSLVAEAEGLEIRSAFRTRIVPWDDVCAIRTWHHINCIDYVAVDYRRLGRVEVATCLDQYGADELRAFVRACAVRVSAGAPRLSITLAGLRDRAVYRPFFRRFAEDLAIATLFGQALGVAGGACLLGLLGALPSTLLAAIRHPWRRTTLVQRDGLWCIDGGSNGGGVSNGGGGSDGLEARPLRQIPRALRLWVLFLGEASYRGTLQNSGLMFKEPAGASRSGDPR